MSDERTVDVQLLEEERHARGRHAGRLGRHVEHDPASRGYDIEQPGVMADVPLRTVDPWPRRAPILDQGDIGSCTGNAAAGWCATDTAHRGGDPSITEADALGFYEQATRIDRIPGYYMPDDPHSQDTGSTGLAVAKALKNDGRCSSYHHAFTLTGLCRALQLSGVLVGVPWFQGFDEPDSSGLVTLSGSIRGGHEVLVRGVEIVFGGDGPGGLDLDRTIFHLDNSWGSSWGDAGSFRWSARTWTQLRSQGSDVVVPAALG